MVMDNQTFNYIIESINRGQTPPTLGYSITNKQFLGIAEAYASHITKHGWNYYLKVMVSWECKIIDYDKFKKDNKYHIVGDITCDMAVVGANCQCSHRQDILNNTRARRDGKS